MATMMLKPPPSRRSGDLDAIEALRAGDERRFIELAALYQPVMSRLARALVPTAHEADALVRTAWTDVLSDLGAVEAGSTLRANLMQRLVAHVPDWRDGDANACTSHRARPAGRLGAALAWLPAGPYIVVTLRDVERWPADEVSDALGLSLFDQRRLLHQGRTAIHRALYGGPSAGAAA